MSKRETNSFYYEERPNGKIRFVRRYYDPNTDKVRRVSTTRNRYTKRIEREAYDYLGERIEKVLEKPTNDILFGDLVDDWYKLKVQQVKPSTAVTIYSRNNIIKNKLGNTLANRITNQRLNNFLLYLQNERGNSYANATQYRSQIEQIFEHGRLYKGLTLEPDLIVQKINLNKKDDFKYLEKHELKSVIEQLEDQGDHETARYCLLQTMTGMRTGELVAVNYKEDIDWKNKTIEINKTYYKQSKTFQSPKSGESRTIHINDDVIKLLEKQITTVQRNIIKWNLPRDKPFLFLTNRGNLCNTQVWNRRLSKVEIKGKKITTHIFRHTFITRMVENGVDAKLIAEHVGHANTDMVEEVYSHFTELMNERLSNAIKELEVI